MTTTEMTTTRIIVGVSVGGVFSAGIVTEDVPEFGTKLVSGQQRVHIPVKERIRHFTRCRLSHMLGRSFGGRWGVCESVAEFLYAVQGCVVSVLVSVAGVHLKKGV